MTALWNRLRDRICVRVSQRADTIAANVRVLIDKQRFQETRIESMRSQIDHLEARMRDMAVLIADCERRRRRRQRITNNVLLILGLSCLWLAVVFWIVFLVRVLP